MDSLEGHGSTLTPTIAALCERLPVPITFADPSLHDMPLIFANSAFCEMTGWSLRSLIGQNCRILQGRDTDRAVTAEMALCCKEKRADIFSVVNYRLNGEKFLNVVALRPFRLSPTRHLIMGCQMEYEPSILGDNLSLHAEAVGSVVHLLSADRSFARNSLTTCDIMRLDALGMRFETAFILAQNAFIQSSAKRVLSKI